MVWEKSSIGDSSSKTSSSPDLVLTSVRPASRSAATRAFHTSLPISQSKDRVCRSSRFGTSRGSWILAKEMRPEAEMGDLVEAVREAAKSGPSKGSQAVPGCVYSIDQVGRPTASGAGDPNPCSTNDPSQAKRVGDAHGRNNRIQRQRRIVNPTGHATQEPFGTSRRTRPAEENPRGPTRTTILSQTRSASDAREICGRQLPSAAEMKMSQGRPGSTGPDSCRL